jgi:hypothetical protein
MKQYILTFLVFVAALTACEPVVDSYPLGKIYTAEQLDISASPIVVGGKQSNKIVLENHTPVLGEWNYGVGVSRLPVDTILILRRGEVNITFNALNADGSQVSKTLSVIVEELSFAVPPEWEYLCGPEGEKSWTWDETYEAVWTESGYRGDFTPDDPEWWWWPVTPAELDDEYFDPGYGEGASMTFAIIDRTAFSRTTGDGSGQESGSFSLNMNKVTYTYDDERVWAKGKLSLSGTTVLCGKIPVNDYERMETVYEFDIIELNADRLVLAAAASGSAPWEPAYFWIFKPLNE